MTSSTVPRHRALLVWAIALVATVPVLVAAASLAHDGWATTGEFAQAELRMRDFWAHPPELGATGRLRDGADVSSHPGPSAWWAMYPVYGALGRDAVALSTAVAVMAAAWIVAGIWQAGRRGGLAAAMAVALAMVGLVRALGPDPFLEPWNPWFGIFPFACCLLAVWATTRGSRAGPALAVAAGSFCIQAHVGYLPIVGVMLLVPAVVVVRGWMSPERRRWIAPTLGALGVGVVMWVLPVHEQLTHRPGNFTVLWRAYAHQDDPALGLGRALSLVGRHLDVVGPWLVHHDGSDLTRGGIGPGTVVLVGLWIVAMAWSWRRRAEPAWAPIVSMHAVLLLAAITSVVTVSRILGDAFSYLVVWLDPLAALVVAAVTWTAWTAVIETVPATRVARTRQVARAASAVVLVAGVVVASIQLADVDPPGGTLSTTTAVLGEQLGRAISDGTLPPDERYQVAWVDPAAFGGVGFGLLVDLERRGLDVVADPVYRTEVRPHRIRPPGGAVPTLWVVSGDDVEAWREAVPEAEVASHDPRGESSRRDADALHDDIVSRLEAVGGDELAGQLDENLWAARSDARVDDVLRRDIDRFAAFGLPAAVFLLPAGTAPPV